MLNSIKARLILWFLLTFSLLFIVSGFYLYLEQKRATLSGVDRFLEAKSEFLAGLIEVDPDGQIHFEPQEVGIKRQSTLYDFSFSGHYYQVFFESGRPLALSPSLGDFSLPVEIDRALKEEGYFWTTTGPRGEPLRVYTHKVGLNHGPVRKENERFVIQTAESLEEAYAFLVSLKRLLLYSGPVALLFSGLGGLLIARLSLRPLKLFSKEVGEISEKSLDKRIHEGKVSRELKELAKAFNATLDRLEEAFRQQKRFLSDASHEIRTPVSVIKSYCEIPLRKARSSEEYKRALEVIFEQIKKMEILIENLLTLSRLEQKRLSTHLERIALDDLVENTVSLLAPLAERKGIPIRIVPRPSVVQGDKTQLMEVFMNIIDNAIKYNRPGGGIEITFKEEEKEIIVEVADGGIGISNEALPHIFERFYRADPSRAKEADTALGKTQGAGLGLSIVKEIVENHQGRITVQSEPGVGSTFSIHLPKAAPFLFSFNSG